MKLVIVGAGRMGSAVRSLAERRGHEIVATVGREGWDRLAALGAQGSLHGVQAAIDFTLPDQVGGNVERLVALGLPVVVGTTGWEHDRDAVRELVEAADGCLVHGSNFSIGVYVFGRLVREATHLFDRVEDVSPYLVEHHHAGKADAPSGTARQLAEIVRAASTVGGDGHPASAAGGEGRLASAAEGDDHTASAVSGDDRAVALPVASIRAGHEPGRHTVGFDGPFDHVTLTHQARSREGFASGALLATRLIEGRRGMYRYGDLLDDWFGGRR